MQYTIPISQKLKKLIKSLHQKQFRDQNGLFIAEGEKICFELLNSTFETELIAIRDSPNAEVIEITNSFSEKGIPVYIAPKHQFEQMCDTKSPQGIIAVVNVKEQEILQDESFIALDRISDPGNVGAIIRSADWFGFKQVIISTESADRYCPKTVRSSMGSIFKVTTVYGADLAELFQTKFKGFDIYSATLDAEKTLEQFKPKKKFGLIFGSEAHGVHPELQQLSKSNYKIFGKGYAESLNVAVAAGISLYHFSKYI